MALEVIGAGFGRTGTLSLKLALTQLGFGPCHHMDEVMQDPPQVAQWQAIAAGRTVEWEAVFPGFRSQVDWPGAHVWRELAAAYPRAKVLLSVRPEDAWWTSFSNTIGTLLQTYRQEDLPPHVMAMMDAAFELIVNQTFRCPPTDREGVLAAYRRRNADVRATIAGERLLVLDVAEGWQPLCQFLAVPVPDAPFPRVNSTTEFWQLVRGGGRLPDPPLPATITPGPSGG
jgi:hypothetical protein